MNEKEFDKLMEIIDYKIQRAVEPSRDDYYAEYDCHSKYDTLKKLRSEFFDIGNRQQYD